MTDPTLAPKGQSTLYVLLPVTHESAHVDWAKETPRFRELALQQMERIGITGLERRIRTEKILTPSGWREEFGLYQGRDVLDGALAGPDAAPAAAQPV